MSNKSIVKCTDLGDMGPLNYQLMLLVQRLETLELYMGSSVESETQHIN